VHVRPAFEHVDNDGRCRQLGGGAWCSCSTTSASGLLTAGPCWTITSTRMRPATREQALDALRQFHAAHGRLPRYREWERTAPDRPCAKTIERRWGWRKLLAEAVDAEPDELVLWDEVIDERAAKAVAVLREARDELGRWPIAEEWEQSGRKPSRRTFVRYFGSWAEACRAAAGLLT
jgi:hypothetical protein